VFLKSITCVSFLITYKNTLKPGYSSRGCFMKNVLIVVILFLATACGNKHDSNIDDGDLGSSEALSFEVLDENLLKPRCSICHVPGHFSGIDTTSYQAVVNSGLIDFDDLSKSSLLSVIASGFMPLGGPSISTDSDLFMFLEDWVLSGANEFE